MAWGKLLLTLTMWSVVVLALFVLADRQPNRVEAPARAVHGELPKHDPCPPSAIAPLCGGGLRIYVLPNSTQPASSR